MGSRGLALVLVAVLAFQTVAEGKLVRKKSRSANKPVKTRRGTEKYGERLPWEARQETYDWEFREVSLPFHSVNMSCRDRHASSFGTVVPLLSIELEVSRNEERGSFQKHTSRPAPEALSNLQLAYLGKFSSSLL